MTEATQDAEDPVVRLEEIAKTYPGVQPVEALRPCHLTVRQGDFVAVMGPSGSGKSTLLNLLGLLDVPTSGRYLLDGHDVAGLSEAARTGVRGQMVGFVFQASHLVAYRTAVENVELGMVYRGLPRQERRARALAAIQQVRLAHRVAALPATLSGGERQRLAIARAVAAWPRLLLCDEPTGNLDSQTAAGVLELLGEVNTEGHTVIVVTHDGRVAAGAKRLVSITDGVVAERDAAAMARLRRGEWP
jgi:putative ABC transport system ATP-binding protein